MTPVSPIQPILHDHPQLRRARWLPARHHRDRRGLRRDDDHHRRSRFARRPGRHGRRARRRGGPDPRTRQPAVRSGPHRLRGAVLDAGPGPSLADDGRYQAAVGRVGNEHASVSYVDLAAVRTLIEAHLDEATAEERAEYEESIQPFLAPFDTFAAAMVVGGDVDETHAVVTVK
jgi:hypothetical protein